MNDLYNLGVRVSALEDRVGNVKFTGDARINYVEKEGIDNLDSESYGRYWSLYTKLW